MARLSTLLAVPPFSVSRGRCAALGQNTQRQNSQNNASFDDATFVQKAAYDNMTEIALAKLAESKVTNEQVKASLNG